MEHMPKEDMIGKMQLAERELALLLQKAISDITPDTTEVSWNALEVSLEHPKAQLVDKHLIPLARCTFDFWKNRRHDQKTSSNGSVAVSLEEIFQQLDFQKQDHEGNLAEKQAQEESTEQGQHVLTDVQQLATSHVQGSCTLTSKGRSKRSLLTAPISVTQPSQKRLVMRRSCSDFSSHRAIGCAPTKKHYASSRPAQCLI